MAVICKCGAWKACAVVKCEACGQEGEREYYSMPPDNTYLKLMNANIEKTNRLLEELIELAKGE